MLVPRTLRVAVTTLALCAGSVTALLPVATPAGAVAPVVSVVGSSTMVRPTFDATGFGSIASLTAARNEFESFQVVVTAGGSMRSSVTLDADGPLTGPGGATIPTSAVSIYREAYYTVTRPSDGELWQVDPCPSDCKVPDALIPKVDAFYPNETRNAFPVDVPAGEIRVAWVDVLVPKGQAPGSYTGTMTVKSAAGNLGVVTINLRVLNFEIPSTSTLRGAMSTNPNNFCSVHNCSSITGGGWALYAKYAQAALDNRVTLTNPGYLSPAGGGLTPFRTYAEPLLNGTAPTKLVGAKMTDVILNRYEASNMGPWKSEGALAGFANRISFYCDEMGENTSYWTALCNDPYLVARDAWNGTVTNPDPGPLPVAITVNKDQLQFGRNQGYAVAYATTTLIPVVNQMHPKGGTSQRSAYQPFLDESSSHRLWMYPSCMSSGCGLPYDPNPLWSGWPSYHIDQAATEARAMAWQDFIYDVSGDYHFETVMNLSAAWNTCAGSPPTNCQYNEGANGDGTLFYPGTPAKIGGPTGTDIPVESIRLKRIRDGREDFEYLSWLSKNGHDADARAVARGLFPSMSESNATQAAIDSARGQLANLVDAPVAGAPVIAYAHGGSTGTDANAEIWVMDADGTNAKAVTDSTGAAVKGFYPSWSRDGKKIVFTSLNGTTKEIHVVTLATGAVSAALATNAEKPAWSPDGTRIAFVHAETGGGDIYVMPAGGGTATNLTNNAAADDFDPAWSTSGATIAFASVRAGNVGTGSEVYTMNASDGSGLTNHSSYTDDDDLPAFDPTDAVLAWDSPRTGQVYDIYVNGTDYTNTPSVNEYDPTWSPAGDVIAHTKNFGSAAEIATFNVFGPDRMPRQLTTNGVFDGQPDWLHTGSTFALTVTRSGTGTGTVTSAPAGISCGATCSAQFQAGTVVTLTAAPAAGSSFTGWGGACTGTGSCTVTLNGAQSVTATFTTSTACATSAAVSVADYAFSPKTATVAQGGCVNWTFKGPNAHSATDSKALGAGSAPLFNSGSKASGTYAYRFAAAGTYTYRSIVAGDPTTMTGTVKVPVRSSATSGGVFTPITLTWSSSALSGYQYDVQYRYKAPGSSTYSGWVSWLSNTTALSGSFTASGLKGAGTYQFHSRLENTSTLKASGWCPAKTITIN